MTQNLIFGIDGQQIKSEAIEEFRLREYSRNLRFSRNLNSEVLDFVGFVINEDATFISLPKHYVSKVGIESLGETDVALLFQVLMTNQMKNADKYNGPVKDFDSTFPFRAFFSIQQYYEKFGLYKEEIVVSKPSYTGKISWKDTIRKSANVISSGKIVYLPLFVKETQNKQVFLSECMAFAISYTLEKFPYFVHGRFPRTNLQKFDLWLNRDYVIGRLRKIHSEVYKDIHKNLVKDLIEFYSNVPDGGIITMKHYNFEIVWESIVEKYLNDHFNFMDKRRGLIFENNQGVKFRKAKFYVDKVHPRNRIEPDHYFKDNSSQLIFDAKYYSTISSINYKQVAYQYFLNNNDLVTSNALIIPTEGKNRSEVHFELKEEYYTDQYGAIKIWEYYMNMKLAMQNFIK